MSKTTSVICNHSLNTASVEVLAQDLAKRLNATISYGYNWTFFINKETSELDYDLEFIEIGKIEVENASETYILSDQNLGKKLFVEEYGIEILDSDVFKISDYLKDVIRNESENIEHELTNSLDVENDFIGSIYKNFIDLWAVDSLYWYYYQRQFVYGLEEDDIRIFTNFRKANLEWIKLFGGNFMFVFSFEDKSYKVEEYFEALSIVPFFETIEKEFKEVLVNVSQYYLAKAYQNKPEYVQERISNKYIKLISYGLKNSIDTSPIDLQNPILFYDDFHDLDANFRGDFDYFNFVYDGSHVLENKLRLKQFQNDYVIKREVAKPINLSKYFKLYSCFVTGFKHYVSTDLDLSLQLNQEVFLERELKNEFDKHAIAVCIMYKYKGSFRSHKVKIGYIGKHENYILCKLLDNGYKLKSMLSKISDKALDNSNYNDALTIEIFMEKRK